MSAACAAIRDYTPADRAACLALFDSNVPEYFTTPERPGFEEFLDALPGPYLVLDSEQGELVACGGYAMNDEPGRADLCWGMVRRDLHTQGIGRQLTVERIERARQDPSVTMLALNTSQHTVPFYERLGFNTIEVIPDGYAPGLHRCEMRLACGTDRT